MINNIERKLEIDIPAYAFEVEDKHLNREKTPSSIPLSAISSPPFHITSLSHHPQRSQQILTTTFCSNQPHPCAKFTATSLKMHYLNIVLPLLAVLATASPIARPAKDADTAIVYPADRRTVDADTAIVYPADKRAKDADTAIVYPAEKRAKDADTAIVYPAEKRAKDADTAIVYPAK